MHNSGATAHHKVVDLQRALRAGFNYETKIATRLANVESLIGRLLENSGKATEAEAADKKLSEQVALPTEAEAADKKLNERVAFALQHQAMDQQRALVLAACPRPVGELRTVLASHDGSIRRRLERPPILRQSGFSLETLDQARIVNGELIRVTNGDRKVIDLYRDGPMIFGALADSSFLAWKNDCRLNSIALIEAVYSFARFYQLVLSDYRKRPEEVLFRVELRNMHLGGDKSFLLPYSSGSSDFMSAEGKREAPTSAWAKELPVITEGYDPARVAATLVRELYFWFGHWEKVIPYVKVVDDVQLVDFEKIPTQS